MFGSVHFPAPFLPMIPTLSPCSILKLTSFNACPVGPKLFFGGRG
jgi:hypothetical protein